MVLGDLQSLLELLDVCLAVRVAAYLGEVLYRFGVVLSSVV